MLPHRRLEKHGKSLGAGVKIVLKDRDCSSPLREWSSSSTDRRFVVHRPEIAQDSWPLTDYEDCLWVDFKLQCFGPLHPWPSWRIARQRSMNPYLEGSDANTPLSISRRAIASRKNYIQSLHSVFTCHLSALPCAALGTLFVRSHVLAVNCHVNVFLSLRRSDP